MDGEKYTNATFILSGGNYQRWNHVTRVDFEGLESFLCRMIFIRHNLPCMNVFNAA